MEQYSGSAAREFRLLCVNFLSGGLRLYVSFALNVSSLLWFSYLAPDAQTFILDLQVLEI